MGKAAAKKVVRVIEPELLDREDQAALVEAQMSVRASVKHLAGNVDKLRGQLMRPNAIMQPAAIEAELVKLIGNAQAGLKEVRKLPLAS